jgi:hypothetical protein
LLFEEQNIVVETKIRLEKEDVKNLLQRKMNEARMPGQFANQVRPQPHPHPHPQPQLQPHARYTNIHRPASHGHVIGRMGMGGLSK